MPYSDPQARIEYQRRYRSTKIGNLRNRYHNMKKRCYSKSNPAYRLYGARGIKICDEWLEDFNNFYHWAIDNGFNKSLELDRIDNDKGHSPDNCRWVSHKENCYNKSDTTTFLEKNTRICYGCKKEMKLTKENFYTRKDGRQSNFANQCKKCQSKSQKLRYMRIKQNKSS